MTLKTATLIAMLGTLFALGGRFLLMLWSVAQMARLSTGGGNLGFVTQSLLYFAVDAVAYGALVIFLYVLWSKQQPPPA